MNPANLTTHTTHAQRHHTALSLAQPQEPCRGRVLPQRLSRAPHTCVQVHWLVQRLEPVAREAGGAHEDDLILRLQDHAAGGVDAAMLGVLLQDAKHHCVREVAGQLPEGLA